MLEVGERVSLLLVVTIAVHEICTHIDWDCQWGLRSTSQGDSNLDIFFSHLGLRNRGRQTVEEIWTCDLFIFRASLCVACEIVLRAVRALCYVLLHVLYHYNIQIVGGFQLLLSPVHTVLYVYLILIFMCACDCFYFRILMINCRRGYVLCMKLK